VNQTSNRLDRAKIGDPVRIAISEVNPIGGLPATNLSEPSRKLRLDPGTGYYPTWRACPYLAPLEAFSRESLNGTSIRSSGHTFGHKVGRTRIPESNMEGGDCTMSRTSSFQTIRWTLALASEKPRGPSLLGFESHSQRRALSIVSPGGRGSTGSLMAVCGTPEPIPLHPSSPRRATTGSTSPANDRDHAPPPYGLDPGRLLELH